MLAVMSNQAYPMIQQQRDDRSDIPLYQQQQQPQQHFQQQQQQHLYPPPPAPSGPPPTSSLAPSEQMIDQQHDQRSRGSSKNSGTPSPPLREVNMVYSFPPSSVAPPPSSITFPYSYAPPTHDLSPHEGGMFQHERTGFPTLLYPNYENPGPSSAPSGQNEQAPGFFNPFEASLPQVKHRRRTSRQQFKVLEETFRVNPKPSGDMRRELGEQLQMTPRGVQVWFQNRRAKEKTLAKKQAEGGEVPVPPQPKIDEEDEFDDSFESPPGGNQWGGNGNAPHPHSSDASGRPQLQRQLSGGHLGGPYSDVSGNGIDYQQHPHNLGRRSSLPLHHHSSMPALNTLLQKQQQRSSLSGRDSQQSPVDRYNTLPRSLQYNNIANDNTRQGGRMPNISGRRGSLPLGLYNTSTSMNSNSSPSQFTPPRFGNGTSPTSSRPAYSMASMAPRRTAGGRELSPIADDGFEPHLDLKGGMLPNNYSFGMGGADIHSPPIPGQNGAPPVFWGGGEGGGPGGNPLSGDFLQQQFHQQLQQPPYAVRRSSVSSAISPPLPPNNFPHSGNAPFSFPGNHAAGTGTGGEDEGPLPNPAFSFGTNVRSAYAESDATETEAGEESQTYVYPNAGGSDSSFGAFNSNGGPQYPFGMGNGLPAGFHSDIRRASAPAELLQPFMMLNLPNQSPNLGNNRVSPLNPAYNKTPSPTGGISPQELIPQIPMTASQITAMGEAGLRRQNAAAALMVPPGALGNGNVFGRGGSVSLDDVDYAYQQREGQRYGNFALNAAHRDNSLRDMERTNYMKSSPENSSNSAPSPYQQHYLSPDEPFPPTAAEGGSGTLSHSTSYSGNSSSGPTDQQDQDRINFDFEFPLNA